MARAANRKIQGISLDHFYWDYIICFRSSVEGELKSLESVIRNNAIRAPQLARVPKAKIVLLPTSFDKDDLTNWAKRLMHALEEWMGKNFRYEGHQWKVPEKPIKGMWRTKQIVIPGAQYDALRMYGTKSEWTAIETATKCDLKATSEMRDGSRLVTISGGEEGVRRAAERMEKFWF